MCETGGGVSAARDANVWEKERDLRVKVCGVGKLYQEMCRSEGVTASDICARKQLRERECGVMGIVT